MVLKEIKFEKYKERGDYHWQGLQRNIFYFNAFLQARYELVLKQLPKLKSDEKIIDVGCGDGVLSYLIAKEKGGKIYGIDPSFEAIKIAKEKMRKLKMSRCNFKIANGYNLPFADNFFNYAVCADVIEHVAQPGKLLKEIKRVLKPKGRLILSSVIKNSLKPEEKMHIKEYTVNEMKNLLKKYFTDIKIIESHPVFLKKIYQCSWKLGRYQPQPWRYLINFLTIFYNPFLLNSHFKFSCQTVIAFKDAN